MSYHQLSVAAEPNTPGTINLRGVIDFNTVSEGLDALSGLLGQGQQTAHTLDLSGVTRSNSAALALLVECKAMAKKRGLSVQFSHLPNGVWQLAEVCEADALIR